RVGRVQPGPAIPPFHSVHSARQPVSLGGASILAFRKAAEIAEAKSAEKELPRGRPRIWRIDQCRYARVAKNESSGRAGAYALPRIFIHHFGGAKIEFASDRRSRQIEPAECRAANVKVATDLRKCQRDVSSIDNVAEVQISTDLNKIGVEITVNAGTAHFH